jgi:2',3'-cyclic-nucleotide 2'-phosphodiesterase (5'-nucleotidase family)
VPALARFARVAGGVRVLRPAPAVLSVALLAGPLAACGGSSGPVTILYTADAQGYLEECACETGGMLGGVARRATLVDSLRAAAPGAALLVEAGDFATGPGPRGELVGFVAARAMAKMGYDAVLPGEVELNLGPAFFETLRPLGLPLVHTNFGTPALGPPQAEPLVIERDGRRVAVMGLLGPDLVLLEPARDGLVLEDPGEAARRALRALRDRPDLVVALVHGRGAFADSVAANVPGIDVVVAGHTSRNAADPERRGEAVVVTAGFLGQHVGELRLSDDDLDQPANALHRIETTLAEDPEIARWVGIAAPR